MKRKLIIFTIWFIVWCAINWPPDMVHLILGAIVSLIVTYFTAGLFSKEVNIRKLPLRIFWFVRYLVVFIIECTKANIDVAWRVIHPLKPLNPGIVKVKTKLKSTLGLTFLANSITLTPGTLTVDIDRDKGIVYVHWIDVKTKDINKATEIIVKRFEDILIKIFE